MFQHLFSTVALWVGSIGIIALLVWGTCWTIAQAYVRVCDYILAVNRVKNAFWFVVQKDRIVEMQEFSAARAEYAKERRMFAHTDLAVHSLRNIQEAAEVVLDQFREGYAEVDDARRDKYEQAMVSLMNRSEWAQQTLDKIDGKGRFYVLPEQPRENQS